MGSFNCEFFKQIIGCRLYRVALNDKVSSCNWDFYESYIHSIIATYILYIRLLAICMEIFFGDVSKLSKTFIDLF